MSIERYIYYRVKPELADRLPQAAVALQEAVRSRHAGLQTRLLVKSADPAQPRTWMEIYAAPASAGGVDDAMLADIEALARIHLAGAIAGERHVETFQPCA